MAKGRKTGGRQSGTPNKATFEIREAARLLLDDPDYRCSLQARLIAGKAGAIETLLFHYAYGKPKEVIENEPQTIVVRWQNGDSPGPSEVVPGASSDSSSRWPTS